MKNPAKILFRGFLSIIIMLISLGILNIVALFVFEPVFQSFVAFFNINLLFIILISLILLFGELFAAFIFPFNLVYPLFNAIGGAMVVTLIRRIFTLIDSFINTNLAVLLAPLFTIAMIIVIIVTLIVGYVHVFIRPFTKKGSTRKKKTREWEDVGDEFKEAAYNLASTVKEKLEPKKRKKK